MILLSLPALHTENQWFGVPMLILESADAAFQVTCPHEASLVSRCSKSRCFTLTAAMSHETCFVGTWEATVRIKIVLTRWWLCQDIFLFSLDKLSCFPWTHERHFFSLLFNEFDVSVEVNLGWCRSTNWQSFSDAYLSFFSSTHLNGLPDFPGVRAGGIVWGTYLPDDNWNNSPDWVCSSSSFLYFFFAL